MTASNNTASSDKIEKQNDFFDKMINLHEKLSEGLVNEENMLEMAIRLSNLICKTITIEPFFSNIRHICVGDLEKRFGDSVYFQNSSEFNTNAEDSHGNVQQYQVEEIIEERMFYRLVSPISVNGKMWGIITAIQESGFFDEYDQLLLKYSANFFSLKVIEDRRIKDIIVNIQGDFIDDLLSAHITDKKLLLYNAKKMNYDLTKPHRVIMMRLDLSPEILKYLTDDEERMFTYKRTVTESIKTWLMPYGNHLVVSKSNRILLLLNDKSKENNNKYARKISEEILSNLSDYYKEIVVTIGIGKLCTELEEYRESYETAMKSIELGLKLNKRGRSIVDRTIWFIRSSL